MFPVKLFTVVTLGAVLSLPITAAEASKAVAPKPVRSKPFYPAKTRAAKPAAYNGGIAVVNAASYLPGISPGGLITIFGQNLTNVNGVVSAGTNPLPVQLENVSVTINGLYAPIFSIAFANGEDQISVQVPYETPVGPGAADVIVYNYGQQVGSAVVDSFTEDPGIFMFNGTYAVAVHGNDYSLITPGNPAYPGEVIVLYTTGLGPLSVNLQDGYGAPYDPLAYTQDPFTVTVDGEACQVEFSGLGPGYVGLYQLNILLPRDLPAGNLNIQISSPYANSGIATLPVN